MEELHPPISSESHPTTPSSHSQSPKSWFLAGILGFLGLCAICAITVGFLALQVNKEKAPVEAVLHNHIQALSKKDVKGAYALLSPRAQRQIPISEVENLVNGDNYVLFEGYRRLSVDQIKVSLVTSGNPDLPQGTVAQVSGTIEYTGGVKGRFDSTLEKVDGQWMIDSFFVTIPPEKLK